MKKYIYWTKKGKFETNNFRDIPVYKLHSLNEETPAIIHSCRFKIWYFEGSEHRLSGPAMIFPDGDKEYYLNGTYCNFKYWILCHPNIDIYLEANGHKTIAQKTFWKLQNL